MKPISNSNNIDNKFNCKESSPTSPSLKRTEKIRGGSQSLSDLQGTTDELADNVAKIKLSYSDPGVNSRSDFPRKYYKICPKRVGDKKPEGKQIGGDKNEDSKTLEHEKIGLDIDSTPKRRIGQPESEYSNKKKPTEH